ncbi:hypothetical protein B0A55_04809 [Friedmanniomyces simplex]|uniref:C2H2-type domain-containing protein n=1 Tax=Friedmanniomyces simplex TaxID=329884 RepID=A0A4U0XJW2_9PEZI|nr:hypothetical protein B0A55_04809 [Friedmanniomyces simplex]
MEQQLSSAVGAKCSRCDALFSDRYLMVDHLGTRHRIDRGVLRQQTEPNATPRVRDQTWTQAAQDQKLGRVDPSRDDVQAVENAERTGIEKRRSDAWIHQINMPGPSHGASSARSHVTAGQAPGQSVGVEMNISDHDTGVEVTTAVTAVTDDELAANAPGTSATSLTRERFAEFRAAFDDNEELAEWLGSWTNIMAKRIPRTVQSIGPSINGHLRGGSVRFTQDELLMAVKQLESRGVVELMPGGDVQYARLAGRRGRS